MKNAIDVANFFIDIAIHNEEDCMTNLRLNKLLYFAQGWSLAKLGKPLFKDDILPWKLGPVVANVYHKYKRNKENPIKNLDWGYSLNNFTQEEQTLLIDVMREYGQYSTPKLVDIAHEIGTPWYDAYQNDLDVISVDSIKDYFLSIELKSFDEQIDLKKNMVGRLDEDGIPVLPVDFDDEW